MWSPIPTVCSPLSVSSLLHPFRPEPLLWVSVCFSQSAPVGVRHGGSMSGVVVGGLDPGSEGSWRSPPHGSRQEACEGAGHCP